MMCFPVGYLAMLAKLVSVFFLSGREKSFYHACLKYADKQEGSSLKNELKGSIGNGI